PWDCWLRGSGRVPAANPASNTFALFPHHRCSRIVLRISAVRLALWRQGVCSWPFKLPLSTSRRPSSAPILGAVAPSPFFSWSPSPAFSGWIHVNQHWSSAITLARRSRPLALLLLAPFIKWTAPCLSQLASGALPSIGSTPTVSA